MAKKGKKIQEKKKSKDRNKKEEKKELVLKQEQLQDKCERLKEQLEAPSVQLQYQYVIDLLLAKLRLINEDLSQECSRQVIRSMSSRIKSSDSVIKKLIKKQRDVTFETAVSTLNDIAGVRVVCYFCDDIYRVAEAIRRQQDLQLIKEKDYVNNPKKSGYQSIHHIIEVPLTYNDYTTQLRVELQIRSFAMDYWAELDNQMCYKKNSGEIANIEKETRNYSDVIAKVDNQMLELRKRIIR